MQISDRELEQWLIKWGRQNRARLDISAKASEEKNRACIMQRIQEMSAKQQPAASPLSVFSLLRNVILAERIPIGVIASFVLVISLSGSVVYSSQGSLPGDRLYPFKLQLEQAQIQMSPTGSARLEKKIAFAERRLQEFLAFAKQNGSGPQTEKVRGLIQVYRNNIQELSGELAQLRGQADSRQLLAAAVRLDETASSGLKQLQTSLGKGLDAEIKNTRQAANQASKKAVDVIASVYDRAGLTADQVRSRIEQKISATRQEVQSAAAEQDGKRPAKTIYSDIQQQLAAAEQHLAKADFGNAMTSWSASQTLIDEVKDNPTIIQQSASPFNQTKPAENAPTAKKTAAPAVVPLPANSMQIDVWYSPSKDAYYFDEAQDAQR